MSVWVLCERPSWARTNHTNIIIRRSQLNSPDPFQKVRLPAANNTARSRHMPRSPNTVGYRGNFRRQPVVPPRWPAIFLVEENHPFCRIFPTHLRLLCTEELYENRRPWMPATLSRVDSFQRVVGSLRCVCKHSGLPPKYHKIGNPLLSSQSSWYRTLISGWQRTGSK